MRRLTDLWPNLLGRFRQGEEEGREPRQIVQGEENEESQLLLEAYENLYWTRVIAVRDFLDEHNPAALREMAARFLEAVDRGLWQARSNSAYARLSELTARPMEKTA